MNKLKVGGRYKIRDGGTIAVQSSVGLSDNHSPIMRCTTETGEVVMYDEVGRILPLDGGKELSRYNVVGEVRYNG